MDSQRLALLLFGPPGAGKSTQTEFLLRRYPMVALSTGQLLREEIAAGTAIGHQVQAILARGELVQDELIVPLLRDRLAALPAERGFLLDGFPRRIPQAQVLDQILDELHRRLDAVINLQLSVSEAIQRLGGRRLCHGNGPDEIIHINDQAAIARCSARGGVLVQRYDDLPDVIVRRLGVYTAQTEPLLQFYRPRSIVRDIDASGSADEVSRRILAALEPIQTPAGG